MCQEQPQQLCQKRNHILLLEFEFPNTPNTLFPVVLLSNMPVSHHNGNFLPQECLAFQGPFGEMEFITFYPKG